MKMATWVNSPSVNVGCLLQEMRNLRHIFEDDEKCPELCIVKMNQAVEFATMLA